MKKKKTHTGGLNKRISKRRFWAGRGENENEGHTQNMDAYTGLCIRISV